MLHISFILAWIKLFPFWIPLKKAVCPRPIIAACVLIAKKMYTEYARIAQFFLAATGVAFSAYLTHIELFVLRATCPWCVLSAMLITLIAILSAMELHEN